METPQRPAREVVGAAARSVRRAAGVGRARIAAGLAALDLTALKAIVRAYRLDPARISARWTAPERIIELIVEQAQARLQPRARVRACMRAGALGSYEPEHD